MPLSPLLGLAVRLQSAGGGKDDLIHALTEAHNAIASSLLAIELYDQQRSTQAVTETLLGDMAKQAS